GVQFQNARCAAGRNGIEPGTLDQNIFSGEGNFAVGAAHHAADALGMRAVTIADHANAGLESAFDAIEGARFFSGLGFAYDDAMIANFVVVVGVQRVAQFEHDVIGDIHDITDAGNAGGFEALAQPWRGGLNLYAANYTRGEAAAEFGGLDFHLEGVVKLGGPFFWFWRRGFQWEVVDG